MDEHRFVLNNFGKITINEMSRKLGGMKKVRRLLDEVGVSVNDSLTEEQKDEARKLYMEKGYSLNKIALKYNISSGIISHLAKKWKEEDRDNVMWQTKWLATKL